MADPLLAKIQESTKGDGVNLGKANILLSTNYKQFPDGSDEYKAQFPLVASLVPEIRQMHRWDHSDDPRAELLALAPVVFAATRGGPQSLRSLTTTITAASAPAESPRWLSTMPVAFFLAYTCGQCPAEKLSYHRPEVLTDPNY